MADTKSGITTKNPNAPKSQVMPRNPVARQQDVSKPDLPPVSRVNIPKPLPEAKESERRPAPLPPTQQPAANLPPRPVENQGRIPTDKVRKLPTEKYGKLPTEKVGKLPTEKYGKLPTEKSASSSLQPSPGQNNISAAAESAPAARPCPVRRPSP